MVTAEVIAVDRLKQTAKVRLPSGDEVWFKYRYGLSVGDVVRVQNGEAHAGTIQWGDP